MSESKKYDFQIEVTDYNGNELCTHTFGDDIGNESLVSLSNEVMLAAKLQNLSRECRLGVVCSNACGCDGVRRFDVAVAGIYRYDDRVVEFSHTNFLLFGGSIVSWANRYRSPDNSYQSVLFLLYFNLGSNPMTFF